MKYDADAGDWFVGFRQPHRDVVCQQRGRAVMCTNRGGSMSKPAPAFGVLTFSNSTDEFETFSSVAKPQRSSASHVGNVGWVGVCEFVFQRFDFARSSGSSPVCSTVLAS